MRACLRSKDQVCCGGLALECSSIRDLLFSGPALQFLKSAHVFSITLVSGLSNPVALMGRA
jgi:hypothetical protein